MARNEEDLELLGQSLSNKICAEGSPEASLFVMQRVLRVSTDIRGKGKWWRLQGKEPGRWAGVTGCRTTNVVQA